MSLLRIVSLIFSVAGARVIAAIGGFLLQILLARTLPPEQVGGYFLMVSTTTFMALVLSLGYPELSLTALARFHALDRPSLVQRFIVAARRDMMRIQLLVVPPLLLGIWLLPMGKITHIALMAGVICAPASIILRFNGYSASVVKRFALAFTPDFIGRSIGLLVLVGLIYLVYGKLNLTIVIMVFMTVNYFFALSQSFLLGKLSLFATASSQRMRLHRALWRQRALPLIIVAFATFAFADIVVLVAALFLNKAELGSFAIVIRVAAIVGFFTQSTQQLIIRDLAANLVSGNKADISTVLLKVNLANLAIMVVAIIATSLFGQYMMALFGPHHDDGKPLLLLFLLAGAIRATGSMNAHLLSLAGQQRRLAGGCILVLMIMFLMSVLLAPRFGSAGIALAVIISEIALVSIYAVLAQSLVGRRGDLIASWRMWRQSRSET